MPKKTRLELTDPKIQGMTAAAAGTYKTQFDAQVRGLFVRVSADREKAFYFHGRVTGPGTQVKMRLGRYPDLSLADARDLAREKATQMRRGIDPRERAREVEQQQAIDKQKAERGTVAAVVADFIERWAKKRNRTWEQTDALFRLYVLPAWGPRPIGSITKADVVSLIDDVATPKVIEGQKRRRGGEIQANRVLAAVRKLFNWCQSRGLLESSPALGVAAPAPENARDRILTDDELAEVWAAAGTLGTPGEQLVKLLILTGQRRGEVAGMARAELTGDREWCLPAERMKSGKPHTVPLSRLALATVESLPVIKIADDKASPWLITTTGESPLQDFSGLKAKLDAAILAARRKIDPKAEPMPAWRLHDLRRTMANGMARLRVRLEVVEKVLHHTSGSFAGVVGVYQRHDFADEKREALEAWASHVERKVGMVDASNVVSLAARAAV